MIMGLFVYKGTLDFIVYREGNVDTLVPNDISISQLGKEILRLLRPSVTRQVQRKTTK